MTQSYKANLRTNSNLWAGRRLSVYRKGYAKTLMHFGAGQHELFSCTNMDISYSYTTARGGLKVGLTVSQALFCGDRYYFKYKIKPRTNRETEYVMSADGYLSRVRGATPRRALAPKGSLVSSNKFLGTELAQQSDIPTPPTEGAISGNKDKTFFGVKKGELEVTAGQQTGTVQQGQVGEASKSGLLIYSPTLSIRIEWIDSARAKFYSQDSNLITVNNQLIKSGQLVWYPRIVKVETLTGETLVKKVSPKWPYFD